MRNPQVKKKPRVPWPFLFRGPDNRENKEHAAPSRLATGPAQPPADGRRPHIAPRAGRRKFVAHRRTPPVRCPRNIKLRKYLMINTFLDVLHSYFKSVHAQLSQISMNDCVKVVK